MTLILGFLPAVPLGVQRSLSREPRRTTRCVLEERRTETSVNIPTPKYRRLADNDDRSHLTRAPFHVSIPYLGETLEGMLGLSNPVELSKRYNKFYRSNFGIYGREVVYVGDFQTIIEMSRDHDNFSTQGILPPFNDMFGQDVMVHLEPPKHKEIRNSVAPAFSPAVMEHYFEEIRSGTMNLFGRIEQAVKEKKSPIAKAVGRHHLNIVINITSGIRDPKFVDRIRLGFENMLSQFMSPLIVFTRKEAENGRREMLDSIGGVIRNGLIERADLINELREYGEDIGFWATKEIKNSNIDMLLIVLAQSSLKTGPNQVHDPAVIDDLANLILFLWAAGYGTSSATVTSGVYEIGRDKAIYDALCKEQDEIVRRAGGAREVTYEQMENEMPLLDSFFFELVRLNPAGAGVVRRPRTDIEVAGHYIKANTTVFMDFWAASRDPTVYPNPDSIVIDRYMKKPGQPVPKMIGFGVTGSPHFCLGNVLAKVFFKAAISTMLREYEFEIDPAQKSRYGVFPDIFPVSGCVVQKFEKRS